MRALDRYWFASTLVAATLVTSVALYTLLSPTIAIHWNARGVVDGWAPKWEGAFIAPCFAVILVVFLIFLAPLEMITHPDAETVTLARKEEHKRRCGKA